MNGVYRYKYPRLTIVVQGAVLLLQVDPLHATLNGIMLYGGQIFPVTFTGQSYPFLQWTRQRAQGSRYLHSY
jgi:hypothetical protein